MSATRILDVYELAYLAGGPCRAVDTAVIALVEAGLVQVDRSTGELLLIDRHSCAAVETGVLDALDFGGHRSLDTVCGHLKADGRLTEIEQRLQADKLLVRGDGLEKVPSRWWEDMAVTGAGRRTLRHRRRSLAPEESDVLRAALSGPAAMVRRADYVALFVPQRRDTSAAPAAGTHPHGYATSFTGGAGVDGFGCADFGGAGFGGGGDGGGGGGSC